ncbi:MAG: porin [Marinagarivorans sp.]|nr:porin [Marinagarivorans sp.]
MNKTLSIALAVAMSSPLYAVAAPTLYGKANVTYSSVKNSAGNTDTSITELASNASRIGVKGSEKLTDTNLEVIYQAEFQIDIDDGNTAQTDAAKKQTFTQRNIFIGVKGGFGTVQAGKFDSPLKTAQNKVDLFNDLYGDIAVLSNSENRPNNSVMYSSPSMAGFTLYGDVISSENDKDSNGTSLAATYDNGGLYAALAYDMDVTVEDTSTVRGVLQYTFSNLQLGALVEQFEPVGDADKLNAAFASAKYSMGKWALLGQFGQSDIVKGEDSDGTTFSVGADYSLSSNAKLFAFYTNNAFTKLNVVGALVSKEDNKTDYFGVGMDVKF